MPSHPHPDVALRPALATDADALVAIYNHYIQETIVTFEEAAVSAGEMAGRIHEVQHASLPWIVAQCEEKIVGFAYASKWKGRCAYRFSAEVTVYLDRHQTGRGIGSKLFNQLLRDLSLCEIHAAIGGIALPNAASVALHEKFGFEKVAQFREVGFKFGQWIDVGYWERIL